MSWTNVYSFALTDNLAPLLHELTARQIPHRVAEVRGAQALQVPDARLIEPVAALVRQWHSGELEPSPEPHTQAPVPRPATLSPWRTPVTLALVALSALGFVIASGYFLSSWLGYLTFYPLQAVAGGYAWLPLSEALARGDYWRLITPAFLHFGVFHIVFNGLWTWDLGRRLELVLGRLNYTLLFLVAAAVSNLAQHFWAERISLFGGMSGVVYAFVGYIWIRQWLAPHPLLAVPKGIIIFMLVWLLLCLSGVIDYFLAGSVANGAHVGGLLAGVLIAGAFSLAQRAGFIGHKF